MRKRMAIIGCGRISKNHVIAAANNIDDIELVALCDISKDKAILRKEEFAKLTDISPSPKVYEDYKEMIMDCRLDFVAISTESGYHYEQSIFALEQGVSVLVEKPMALSIKHAEHMIKVANENNLNLGVCHQNRFNPTIQELRKALDDGNFGKLYSVSANVFWNRGKQYYEQAPWRGTYELDGGALMNQCIHNIDLLQWVVGSEILQINAMLSNFSHDYLEVEDYGSIQIRFANGVIGNIQGTVAVYPKNFKETLTVLGEKGTVEIGGLAVNEVEHWVFEDKSYTLDDVKRNTSSLISNVYGNGHTPLYKDFVMSLLERRPSYISGDEGIKALSIILSAYEKEGVLHETFKDRRCK